MVDDFHIAPDNTETIHESKMGNAAHSFQGYAPTHHIKPENRVWW
jgi:hypothetical protein